MRGVTPIVFTFVCSNKSESPRRLTDASLLRKTKRRLGKDGYFLQRRGLRNGTRATSQALRAFIEKDTASTDSVPAKNQLSE